jgi:FlaA1/EpsC-like NDP-sugar epimerase
VASPLAPVALLGQLLLFVAAKGTLGLYPGHGLAPAQRLRQNALAVVAGLLANAGAVALLGRVAGLAGGAAGGTSASAAWPVILAALLAGASDPALRRVLQRLGRWQQPVFIFGGGEAAAGLVRQLAFYPQLGLRPVCIVDDSSIYIAEERQGIPVIRFRELGDHAELLAVTTTALVVEQLVERSFILRLYTTGIFRRILLVPSCHDLISLNSRIRHVGSMLAIQAGSERPSPIAAWCKRAFDVAAPWRCCSWRPRWG